MLVFQLKSVSVCKPKSFSYKENELFAKQITCLFLAFPFIIGYL